MGTRADFYVGRGADAEWIGSVAWDGHPDGIEDDAPSPIIECADESSYRTAVAELLASRKDATLPSDGWPWPWETSHTTDFAYAFDVGQVWASSFGEQWWPANVEPTRWDEESEAEITLPDLPADAFPQMDPGGMAKPGSRRSGIMLVSERNPD